MKAQRLLPLCSALFLGLAAAPAFAGSASVSNSFSIRDIKNGYSHTSINVNEWYGGIRSAGADASKVSVGVTTTKDGSATTQTKYCGRNCRKSTTTYNGLFSETDYSVAKSSSWSRESGLFTKDTNVHVYESYDFDGIDKTHTVGSSFSF
ncbi:hypothetical protein [Acaryochloris sp. CCMEE 5410]|uniref:hypothetical protein n=1 Tax=Acaryochloris sp. CCMEE 5410 TaxID=310037 RepID=UPI00024851CD|nr:hypothetical protein [Acaryochloris sp. CCMEE 5410]KAI9133678.1 hypothetical protein ON05_010470 [Acaryochloris sp. CCMEE 5410]